jgi:hypothetical protein
MRAQLSHIGTLKSKAKDAIGTFRAKYESIIGQPHTLAIVFHYATIASELPDPSEKIWSRIENLKHYVVSVLSLAKVEFSFWSSATLLQSARSVPSSSVVVPVDKHFSTSDQSTVCIVKLTDFAEQLLLTADAHLQTRYLEPNVRDYQGRSNPVNKGIRTTLENPATSEDFWWLNNGITILATGCGITGDRLKIDNPEIVNGTPGLA